MKSGLAIYALTARAARTARRLAEAWPQAELFLPARLADPGLGERSFQRLAGALAANFTAYRGHLVFAAAGVVVRALAGLPTAKDRDPAVVVLDADGSFAVSLLSGHLGGANELAREAAAVLGGRPVITTATDAAGKPALEVLADELGLKTENLPALSGVARRVVEDEPVPVYDPGGWLWPALAAWPGLFARLEAEPLPDDGPLIWVHWRLRSFPSPEWLVLRPPCLAVGLGCNRGTGADEMEGLLEGALARAGLSLGAVSGLASVEAKRDEPGLAQLARRLECGIRFYQANELDAVEVPNPSPAAARHVRTKSVCEAAALLAAGSRSLLIPKKKSANATLAVALAGSM